MICANCGSETGIIERVGFRQTCPSCDAWLHSCVNCRFWSGSGCMEPSADKVGDTEGANFCEWYREKAQDEEGRAEKSGDRASAEEIWKKLTKK